LGGVAPGLDMPCGIGSTGVIGASAGGCDDLAGNTSAVEKGDGCGVIAGVALVDGGATDGTKAGENFPDSYGCCAKSGLCAINPKPNTNPANRRELMPFFPFVPSRSNNLFNCPIIISIFSPKSRRG
jgi:hypothetical protein